MSTAEREADGGLSLSIGGQGRIHVSMSARRRESLIRGLDPLKSATTDGVVLVRLEDADAQRQQPSEVQHAANDNLTTTLSDGTIFVRDGSAFCSVPDALDHAAARLQVDTTFPIRRLTQIVRSVVQLRLLTIGAVAVHASCIAIDGRAHLVAGWSESGKTEVSLALVEQGAEFVSDKWTILLPDGTVEPFPVGVGVRRWVLPYLPHLKRRLPARTRTQFGLARAFQAATAPLRRTENRALGAPTAAAHAALAMADRAGLSWSELRAIYGSPPAVPRRLPLGSICILRTVQGEATVPEVLDEASGVRRLATSAAYERKAYFALRQRAAYMVEGLAADGGWGAAVEREMSILGRLLVGRRIVEVSMPFPADPRPAAEQLARTL